ncbi:MAG: diphosphate--fructose-6-phosphate 1-phosphotransferase [bacterium]|nr:diphosphate--fructose-6-phosphate 1-phosphotransferase [bacterium]
MPRNVIVAQSGGPSPVINSSLQGVIEGCQAYPETFGTIYAAWHGIEGVLKEELLNLSVQEREEVKLLRYTPAAGAIGTCRYKLKEKNAADFQRVIEVFKAHDIGYFFYTGGNDSMDTAYKVAKLAREQGLELIATGVPKTIDNDVGDAEFKLVDHTPGYGSTARYWAYVVQNAEEENRGSSPADPVLVLQAMGRKIGYIPAAARLADPEREFPMQIYMAESGLTLEQLGENVVRQLGKDGRCIVVISEGFEVGEIGAVKDAFGHTAFGASQMTVAQVVTNYLNTLKFPVPGKARCQVPGTDQRSAAIYASEVDIEEAYRVGWHAVEIARKEGNGWMATILRGRGGSYAPVYEKVPLEAVANSERTFPKEWISKDGIDVTDEFVRYARPLIGEGWPAVPLERGLQRFTRFKKVFAEKRLAEYVPQAYREK